MHCALALTLISARPFMDPMANRGMGWVATSLARPFVRVQLHAVSPNGVGEERLARPPVRLVAPPKPRLVCLAPDTAQDWRASVGAGAVALALLGPSAWRVVRVAMGRAFFPPHVGTARRPRRRCPPASRGVRWRAAGLGGAAGGWGAVGAPVPARGRGGPSAPPGHSPAAAAPGSLAADGSWRRRYRSARGHSQRTPGTGRPDRGPVHGSAGDLGSRSAGLASPLGGGGVPARGDSGHRPASRLWGKRSDRNMTT
jgi:hypothetical protein